MNQSRHNKILVTFRKSYLSLNLLLGTTTSSASEDGTVDLVTGHGVDDSATGDGVRALWAQLQWARSEG